MHTLIDGYKWPVQYQCGMIDESGDNAMAWGPVCDYLGKINENDRSAEAVVVSKYTWNTTTSKWVSKV